MHHLSGIVGAAPSWFCLWKDAILDVDTHYPMQAQSLIALGNAIRESIEKQQALLNVGGLRTIAFAMKVRYRPHTCT